MDLQLNNKLAVVTGSTGDGIGYAIAALAKQGAYIVVNGRSKTTVHETVQSMVDTLNTLLQPNSTTPRVFGVVGDLGSLEGVKSFILKVQKVEAELNTHVEILINNVGIFNSQDYFEITDEKWLEYYNINVMSGERLSRHFLTEMLEKRPEAHGRFCSLAARREFVDYPT
jgi:3-oxoacyl-[acyl-carrier protein] reductase